MSPLTPAQLAELRRQAFLAVDGVWFLEVEQRLGFDQALAVDIAVWERFGPVMVRRIRKMLGLDGADAATVEAILHAFWQIEGSQVRRVSASDEKLVYEVERCAWWEHLKRAGRETVVPCDRVTMATYIPLLTAIDPAWEFAMSHALPRGDPCCRWVIRRQSEASEARTTSEA